MFHKIILGSDGSEGARNAALLASEFAKRFESQVVVVNAFDISFAAAGDIGPWSLSVTPQIMQECMEGERAAAENAVKPLLETLQPSYQMLQELGHPVDAILSVAQREQADLIVVGSRGLSGLKEIFLGSVSHGILHHAHCPVLVERGEPRPIRRILLASDSSASAWKAAEAACELGTGFNACLTVLMVHEPVGRARKSAGEPHPVRTPEELQEYERRRPSLEAGMEESAKETGATFQICQEEGHPGETIVRFAAEKEYDLIVMGSRGLGKFERLLLGSVSNYVAHHASCPVLIVR